MKTPTIDSILWGLVPLLVTLPLAAQTTITSDRPGLGSGSAVLAPGLLQAEIGGEYADADAGDQIALGLGLLRFGVFDGFEVQGLLGSFIVPQGDDDGTRGLLDVGLGAKLRLPSPADRLTWSLLGTVLFPTGTSGLTGDEIVPGAFLLADLAVADRVNVGINAGSSGWASDAIDQAALIITPSLSLSPTTGLYAGYAGYYSKTDDLHYLEGGLTWLRGSDLQLDLNGGVEVDSGATFIGIGVAKRWPT